MAYLSVYPNPYFFLDPTGRAQGAVCKPPDFHSYVGAVVDQTVSNVRAFRYMHEAQNVPSEPYYLDAIKGGLLIAADAPTATAAGVSFTDLSTALAAAKADAVTHWNTLHSVTAACVAEEVPYV